MREPTRRPPVRGPGWNERAAVALLVVVAGPVLAAEPPSAARPRTPDRLARFVAAHDLPALVAVCEGSPSEQARHGAHQLRRLIRAGQAGVYQRVMRVSPSPSPPPSSASTSLVPPPRPASISSRRPREVANRMGCAWV